MKDQKQPTTNIFGKSSIINITIQLIKYDVLGKLDTSPNIKNINLNFTTNGNDYTNFTCLELFDLI